MDDSSLTISEKHPLFIRISHWINVPLILIMIWSGILIYWAYQPYVKMPKFFVDNFSLHHRLGEGMGWHFFIMWIFSLNGLIYVTYLLTSGEWKTLFPTRQSLKDLIPTILYELKISKTPVKQEGKFNAAQRLAYTGVIFMGLGSLITGLAIYKPVQLSWLTTLLGGYQAARFEHFFLMICFVFFIILHITQVMRAGWNNFRAMVAGYEIEND